MCTVLGNYNCAAVNEHYDDPSNAIQFIHVVSGKQHVDDRILHYVPVCDSLSEYSSHL